MPETQFDMLKAAMLPSPGMCLLFCITNTRIWQHNLYVSDSNKINQSSINKQTKTLSNKNTMLNDWYNQLCSPDQKADNSKD